MRQPRRMAGVALLLRLPTTHFCVLLMLPMLLLNSGEQTSFASAQETPTTIHLRRLRGDVNVTISCRTDGRSAHWAFNGLLLPRAGNADYAMVHGVGSQHNLTIRNLRDNLRGNYTCMVLPSTVVLVATVTVLVAPIGVEIVGHQRKSVIDVQYGANSVNLTCRTWGANPPATLLWLKRGEALTQEGGLQMEVLSEDGYTTTRELSIPQPRQELNRIPFTCLVQHEALTLRRNPMNVTFNFSVFYPPGQPQIYDFDETITRRPGDLLNARCESHGGNPLPSVHWYKNGQSFFHTFTSDEERMTVKSVLSVFINASDNGAVFRCVVFSPAMTAPFWREKTLGVKFPPSSVKITGHEKAKAGERVTLTCTTSSSSPAASIIWLSRAQVVTSFKTYETAPSVYGGYTASSNITVNLTREDDNAEYTCQATNPTLGTPVTDSIQLQVNYPPYRISISGYNESYYQVYNTILRMTCRTDGGRPIPELSWAKDSTTVSSTAKTGFGREIAMREIEIITKPDDNNARYTCSATSSAMDSPMTTHVTLRVYYPPQNVTLRHEPDPIRAGYSVTFVCNSGSSNPASEITWYKNGAMVQGTTGRTAPAAFGGRSNESRYEMIAQASDNGILIQCRAFNNYVAEGTTEGRILSIHHMPIYAAGKYQTILAVEVDGTVSANFTPSANPPPTEYNWFKGAEKLVLGAVPGRTRRDITKTNFYADGGAISFVNVTKADAGLYRVEAKNTEGTGTLTFTLDVHYAASITELTLNDASGVVKLTCEADANPATPDMVKFSGRVGYDMAARTTQTYANKKAELTITNVVKDDLGEFTCTANNNIGSPAVKTISVLVPIVPIIDKSPQFAKAATRNGEGNVKCFITAYPRPTLVWKHKGAVLDATTGKYSMTIKDGSDRSSFEAVLLISNASKLDYGAYGCTASTPRGEDSTEILLEGTSKPDPPYDLLLVNATSHSIKIAWTRGFDGGLDQSFKVRYRVTDSHIKGSTYKDAYESPFEVQGLSPSTTYELTVASTNELGQSDFISPAISVTTLADLTVKTVEAKEETDEATLIVILSVAIVGVLLFILNAFLVVLFVRRRRRQRHLIEDSTSQANTLELYGTQNWSVGNGFDDSRSYTTCEKSVDYGEDCIKNYENDTDGSDEEEDVRNPRYAPAPGTYLTDHPLLPSQPWAGVDASRSGANFNSFDPAEISNGTTSPDNYADKLRAAGKRMPQARDTLQRTPYGTPPGIQLPQAFGGHFVDSVGPGVPEQNYSALQNSYPQFLTSDNARYIPESERAAVSNYVAGQYI